MSPVLLRTMADIAGAILLAASIYLPVLWDAIRRGW